MVANLSVNEDDRCIPESQMELEDTYGRLRSMIEYVKVIIAAKESDSKFAENVVLRVRRVFWI